jgi:hypothetical protein
MLENPSYPMHHDIQITLQNGSDAVPPTPLPEMTVRDTVRYYSDDGEVVIRFPGISPFREDNVEMTEVQDRQIMTILQDSASSPSGVIVCQCFIKLPGGNTVGWSLNSPASGGEHHVKKP